MNGDTYYDTKNHLWLILYDFVRNFQLFIPNFSSRIPCTPYGMPNKSKNIIASGFYFWRRCEVHDEWDIYFKTTTVSFCDLWFLCRQSVAQKIQIKAWDEKHMASALRQWYGKIDVFSTVLHDVCAVYWQSDLELIELLTDITSTAAQNNKSLASNVSKQMNESDEKKTSIK